jgi:hypothetical protein
MCVPAVVPCAACACRHEHTLAAARSGAPSRCPPSNSPRHRCCRRRHCSSHHPEDQPRALVATAYRPCASTSVLLLGGDLVSAPLCPRWTEWRCCGVTGDLLCVMRVSVVCSGGGGCADHLVGSTPLHVTLPTRDPFSVFPLRGWYGDFEKTKVKPIHRYKMTCLEQPRTGHAVRCTTVLLRDRCTPERPQRVPLQSALGGWHHDQQRPSQAHSVHGLLHTSALHVTVT